MKILRKLYSRDPKEMIEKGKKRQENAKYWGAGVGALLGTDKVTNKASEAVRKAAPELSKLPTQAAKEAATKKIKTAAAIKSVPAALATAAGSGALTYYLVKRSGKKLQRKGQQAKKAEKK